MTDRVQLIGIDFGETLQGEAQRPLRVDKSSLGSNVVSSHLGDVGRCRIAFKARLASVCFVGDDRETLIDVGQHRLDVFVTENHSGEQVCSGAVDDQRRHFPAGHLAWQHDTDLTVVARLSVRHSQVCHELDGVGTDPLSGGAGRESQRCNLGKVKRFEHNRLAFG